jgi:hypothetical protein
MSKTRPNLHKSETKTGRTSRISGSMQSPKGPVALSNTPNQSPDRPDPYDQKLKSSRGRKY